jgi:hypothetical protein
LTSETAWAAGLFEGEGFFWQPTVSRSDQKPRVGAGVTMTDRDTLERFCRSVGMGKVIGPYPQLGLGKKPTWRWHVYGLARVEHLANMLWDGLCSRRQARATEILTEGFVSRNLLLRLPLLPTPVAQMSGNSPENYLAHKSRDGSNRTSVSDLQILVTQCLLPTPTSSDEKSPARFAPNGDPHSPKNGLGLIDWARATALMPTPQAHDARGPKNPDAWLRQRETGAGVSNLNEVVGWMLPSPMARDGDHTTNSVPYAYRRLKNHRSTNLDEAMMLVRETMSSDGKRGTGGTLERDHGGAVLSDLPTLLSLECPTGAPETTAPASDDMRLF